MLFSPTPSITWTGPSGSLPTGRYSLNNYDTTLTIIDVELSDAGKYTCTGTNSIGSYSNQLTVTVNSKSAIRSLGDLPESVYISDARNCTRK